MKSAGQSLKSIIFNRSSTNPDMRLCKQHHDQPHSGACREADERTDAACFDMKEVIVILLHHYTKGFEKKATARSNISNLTSGLLYGNVQFFILRFSEMMSVRSMVSLSFRCYQPSHSNVLIQFVMKTVLQPRGLFPPPASYKAS